MMHVGATARVLSPELPKEQSAGQVLKLFESVSNEFTKTNQPAFGERVIDGYKYSLSINPQIGMIVGNIEKI